MTSTPVRDSAASHAVPDPTTERPPSATPTRAPRRTRVDRMAWLLLPLLVFYAGTLAYPVIRLVTQSMPDGDPLRHYQTLLTESLYLEALVRTFAYATVATLGALAIGYPLAYLMSHGPRLTRAVVTTLIVIPFFVALLVRTFGWMTILARNGPVNNALLGLGLIDEPIQLMYTQQAVLVGMVAVLLPYMVLPLYTVMRRIDHRLTQAANGLGAGGPAAFAFVFLPLSMPGVLAGCVLVFMLGLGFFITPDLLGGSGEQVYPVLLNRTLTTAVGEPAFASAMSVVLLFASFVVLVVVSRIVPIGSIWRPENIAPPRRSNRPLDTGWRSVGVLMWLGRLPGVVYRAPGNVLAGIGLALCLVPMLAAVLMSFQRSTFAAFPSTDLTTQWYREFLSDARWVDAFVTSLQLGAVVAVVVTILSTLAAVALVRGTFPGKDLIMGLIATPLIIPSVALAFGLYLVLFNLRLDGTFAGLVIGHSIPAVPLVTLILVANLRAFDYRLEQAARGLGASPLRAFLTVTLPVLRPGFLVAAFFGFLTSFDELVFTLTLAGTQIRTLPLRLWEDLHVRFSPILAVVSVAEMIVVITVLGVVAAMLRLRQRRTGMKGSIL
ncbi:ABC transporter permease subunit [Micromonospora sp. NBC_01813]|uniref:ABC transporter permease subunit n=1 Tax=Micromonospora sp. NBC_01813 TaxID=2975988 RepID=UPI002DDB9CE7|nr:ABC transporter permease subunit [Micromonospora sp. NBC_01813]WSA10040.1 ABC transporter permease subunit [Micromonospora sp. NBC_01813]